MYSESDFLSISALQHLMFCPRQWGLIHIEQLWSENYLTALGQVMHTKVHDADSENRPGKRITRGLRLHSFTYGLIGQADVVEFHKIDAADGYSVGLEGVAGRWRPVPVEYKRGKPKAGSCDEVQLCAQALCLEEMLGVSIGQGQLFYGLPRRRLDVEFDNALRTQTIGLIEQMRQLFEVGVTPRAKYEKKCKSCSMLSQCMPGVTGIKKNIGLYMANGAKDEREKQ
jgi:CRISPR-associated exonuclease Cas4